MRAIFSDHVEKIVWLRSFVKKKRKKMLATTPAVIETALKIVKDEEIDELRIELDSLENKFDKGGLN